MTDKQIKEEIKQVVTNLGNIEFTVEDELKFCKEVLKRKEQEFDQLKVENEKLTKERDEALDLYNRYEHKFNCPFYFKHTASCIGRKDDFFKHEFCKDYPNCWIKELVRDKRKYKQALQEIKEIAENKLNWTADYKTYFKRDNKSIKQEGFKALAEILQKCEVIKD